MSSLAAARADNFYYPPDFDPKKHQTLNKYNGQHPLRERAAKLDQGILVIRFEVPFNIWCDKCGEHIAKGERFNAEKKAIGQYYSTKVLQFSMTHHCGCRITIQTDPKNAEYLVVEGARKKEESYSAADAEVIELPDEAERERRQRDPLYRLEYQQEAKAKALTGAERLAAIQDMVDARAADPWVLNRALRANLRGEKRAAAALDARHAELGLPDAVQLLPAAETDGVAAQVAFLTSSARAEEGAEARRKRILEQDVFLAGMPGAAAGSGRTGSNGVLRGGGGGGGLGGTATAGGGSGSGGGTAGVKVVAVKRQATATAVAAAKVDARTNLPQAASGLEPVGGGGSSDGAAGCCTAAAAAAAATTATTTKANGGAAAAAAPAPAAMKAAAAKAAAVPASGSCTGSGASSSRPLPGAAALAAAAAARAASVRQSSTAAGAAKSTTTQQQQGRCGGGGGNAGSLGGAGGSGSGGAGSGGSGNGVVGAAARARAAAAGASVRPAGNGFGAGLSGAGAGGAKRSLKDRAAALQRRRTAPGGVGLAGSRPELS